MKFTVVLSADPESGVVTATCPALPGAISEGETRGKALSNIAEAIGLWLEVASETGQGRLPETPELIAEEVAFVLGYRRENNWDLVVETSPIELPIIAAA